MMTEHGAVTKIDPETGKRNDSDRAAYETAFLSRAKALGIPCVLWDNNYFDDGDEWFGLFDRTALRCNSPEVLKEEKNNRQIRKTVAFLSLLKNGREEQSSSSRLFVW